MTDNGYINACDFHTVSYSPVTAYQSGWEDARYQHVYYNPYQPGTIEYVQYHDGHCQGKRDRNASEAA